MFLFFSVFPIFAQTDYVSKVWGADNGDGTYKNPILHAEAREGRWIGAKVGLFFTRPGKFNDAGTADIDWFRFEE